jgi:chromosome segregation ATPase
VDVIDRLRGSELTVEQSDAYERGVVAGEIAARLAGHDQHFAAINGSLADLVVQTRQQTAAMHELRMSVQTLSQQADSAARTLITTADALEKAENQRRALDQQKRQTQEQAWSPWAKGISVISVTVAIVLAIVTIVTLAS